MADSTRNSSSDTAADRAGATADGMAAKATDAIASARNSVHQTVDTVADRATSATQWASQRIDAARQTPSDLVEAGAEYIKARPYTAVAMALAVGYIMGRVGRVV